LSRPEDHGSPPAEYVRTQEAGLLIERNVAVKLRDGISILVDVFRPIDGQPAAPIIAWTPYGKHQNGRAIYDANPGSDVTQAMVSKYATFEGPDPAYWVPRGYAVINADIRGTWRSGGDATFVSPEEAEDFYDLIEWAGVQPWSSGKVGLSGVSYLAVTQWRVAALRPPHLAAINPWEGWTDTYRELARHGGIPDTWFWWNCIVDAWGISSTRIEDLRKETLEHPLYDAFWDSKQAELENITTPAFVVACWADQGLHLRGTVEGFRRISSKDKWLLVHGRKKWAHYYTPDNVAQLNTFFDHFLKGQGARPSWAKARLEVRERYLQGQTRNFDDWPVPQTDYVRLFLDAASGTLKRSAVAAASTVSYSALGSGAEDHRAVFEHVFDKPTALVGHMKLHLLVSTDRADDMDIFVGAYKFDQDGHQTPMAFYSFFDDGPIALGWLRASHRELDAKRSREHQPVLAHKREMKLTAGTRYPVDIELWPSGTTFAAGERLKLVVQGSDLQKYSKTRDYIYFRHEDSVNAGRHFIHTGTEDGSYLLVPVVP
jgi:predicted acyl esterase